MADYSSPIGHLRQKRLVETRHWVHSQIREFCAKSRAVGLTPRLDTPQRGAWQPLAPSLAPTQYVADVLAEWVGGYDMGGIGAGPPPAVS